MTYIILEEHDSPAPSGAASGSTCPPGIAMELERLGYHLDSRGLWARDMAIAFEWEALVMSLLQRAHYS